MNQIRSAPGLSETVDRYMDSVSSIAALSTGAKVPASVPQEKSKADLNAEANGHSVNGNVTAATKDNSTFTSFLAQQQLMMSNQMKMFMEFQQQQDLIRQQQQQMEALMSQLHVQSSTIQSGSVPRLRTSPSSAERRAARVAKDREDEARKNAKLESLKDAKKKKDDEYEAAVKLLEKARREKKMAEKKLVAATESDSEHSYKPSRTATKLDFEDLGASAQFSSDEDSDTIESRRKKKKRKQKEKKLSAASASTSLQSAPVPRTAKQGKTGNGSDGEKLLSVADWAKLCPVKYASSCTAKNINLAMWVWGKLAEIRAALAGSISPLAKGGQHLGKPSQIWMSPNHLYPPLPPKISGMHIF